MGNDKNNIFQKIYDDAKIKINQIMLENRIEKKFREEHFSYTLYIKDSLFTYKLYGHLLNDNLIIYGEHNIPKYSVIVNDYTKEKYCILGTKEEELKIVLDNKDYIRKGISISFDNNLEEVNVIKVGKKYYKFRGE